MDHGITDDGPKWASREKRQPRDERREDGRCAPLGDGCPEVGHETLDRRRDSLNDTLSPRWIIP